MAKKEYCWNHFFFFSECISKHQTVASSFLLLLPILWMYFPVDMEYTAAFLPPAVLWGCCKLGTVLGTMEYGVTTLTKDFLGVGNTGQRFEILLPADLAKSSSNLSRSICSTHCSSFIKVVTLDTENERTGTRAQVLCYPNVSSFSIPDTSFLIIARFLSSSWYFITYIIIINEPFLKPSPFTWACKVKFRLCLQELILWCIQFPVSLDTFSHLVFNNEYASSMSSTWSSTQNTSFLSGLPHLQ